MAAKPATPQRQSDNRSEVISLASELFARTWALNLPTTVEHYAKRCLLDAAKFCDVASGLDSILAEQVSQNAGGTTSPESE